MNNFSHLSSWWLIGELIKQAGVNTFKLPLCEALSRCTVLLRLFKTFMNTHFKDFYCGGFQYSMNCSLPLNCFIQITLVDCLDLMFH